MQKYFLIQLLLLNLFFLWSVQISSAMPMRRRSIRPVRQFGLYKAVMDYAPKGTHKLDLGPFGGIELGIHEDGTIGIGGKLTPLPGVELGASAEFGGSDSEGLGFKVKGHSKVQNELLGVNAGMSGGYSAAVKGLGVHGAANAEGGAEIAGLAGYHAGGGVGGGAGISTSGIGVEAGGNAGAGGHLNAGSLGSIGADVNAGLGGGAVVGPTGVQLSGNANAAASGGATGLLSLPSLPTWG